MSINSNNTLLNEILSTIDDLPTSKEEQEKVVNITENGITEVIPNDGMTLSKVTVNVEVEQSSGGNTIPSNAAVVFKYHNDGDYAGEIKKITINRSTEIPANMFSDNKAPNKYYNYVEEVVLNDEITKMGQTAFGRMASLKRVKLPASLVTLDSAVFTSCPLEELVLPETLQTIGGYCFERFDGEILIIPSNVSTIGSCAFQASKKLKTVYFKGTPTSVAKDILTGCASLLNIYVPWAEDAVANAPWGATNATIHYNTTYDADGNPIVTEGE